MSEPTPALSAERLPPPGAEPRAAPRRWGRWMLGGLGAAVLLAAALLGSGAAWLWATESGTRWALAQVPGLTVTGLQGAAGRGQLSVTQLILQTPAGRLQLDQVQLQGLRYRWRPSPTQWLGWDMASAQVAALHWQSAPSSGPSAAPTDLRLPLALAVDRLQISQVQIDDLPAGRDVSARVDLGADAGAWHRLHDIRLATDRFSLQGQWDMATDAPLQSQAKAQLAGRWDGAPWRAEVDLQGPLAALQSQASLSGEAVAGQPAPALSAQAELRPFAAWPLGDLQLQTQALDLSALVAGAPRTRLRGQVQLRSAGLSAPAQASVALHNDAAAPWGQGGLPVRSLRVEAAGTPSPLRRLDLRALQLELGDARGAAGRVTGQGRWLQSATSPLQSAHLQLALDQVQPAALDARLAAMRLSGPVTLDLSQLQSLAQLVVGFDARLTGQMDTTGSSAVKAPAGPVSLALVGQVDPQGVSLEQLLATAGATRLSAKGQARRVGTTAWRWDAQADLADLNPAVWWPGEPGSAWRRGPHRLNGHLDSSGQAPLAALSDPLARWRELAGQLRLQLAPSELAGVALQGEATLLGAGEASRAQGQLQSGANRLSLDWQASRGRATLDAPALARLAPVLALWPGAAPWAPQAGSLTADLQREGPASAAPWQAQVQATGLQTPSLNLGRLQLTGRSTWVAGAVDPDAPLALSLQADDLVLPGRPQRVDSLRATVTGSLRRHGLQVSADSPLRPPAWFEQLLGARSGSGTRLQAQGEGQWLPGPAAAPGRMGERGSTSASAVPSPGAGVWQLRLQSLQGLARDGSGEPWLAGQDLQLRADLGPGARLQGLVLSPGRLQLPGTALQWQEAVYQAGAGPSGLPRLNVDAVIEPFAVAPLLARAQPELGWRGDLMLAGSVRIRSEQRFDADVVFERQSGDLSLADDVQDAQTRYQALNLSDLRLGLAAHDGVWHFTQALAGRRLGEMAGAATVRTRADLAWPPADAPLEGVLQLDVARLGAWGAWLPPGWRIGGEMSSSASLGGRFGAPEVTGRLSGKNLSVRNALQGVQVSDGEVELRLQGATARVERFVFKGGEGSLSVQGEAKLGDTPELTLDGRADRFQVLGRVDRQLTTSGTANLRLTRDTLSLQGQLKVDEGLIDFSRGGAPGLDDDVSVIDSARLPDPNAVDAASARTAQRRNVSMKVVLNLGDKLRVKGRGLDARLLGDLTLGSTPAGRLAVTGAVRTDRGTYVAYGQKLNIDRGLLTFTGPVDDPRLDIFASRPNLDVTVGVAVTGTALIPRVRLHSEPEMADIDKLSWLVLGRASDGLGRADTALLQRAAVALLAGEGEAPTDAFLNSIGLTDFSVRQDDSGDTRETVITLGKQLSRRWFLGYERSVNAATGTWQLIYRAAQRFTLRAQSGEDNALDLIWTWRWD